MRSRKPSRGLSGSSFRWTHLLVRPSPESLARGKELLEHAIQLDPQFALPYILGVHYTMQATLRPARGVIPLARAAQQEALRVDPSLPEAHALLGVCAGMDYCWSEAEAHWGLAMTRESVSRVRRFWCSEYTRSRSHPQPRAARELYRGPILGYAAGWPLRPRKRNLAGRTGSCASSNARLKARRPKHILLLRFIGSARKRLQIQMRVSREE